jgi:quercetin 2,3-dioxygenase
MGRAKKIKSLLSGRPTVEGAGVHLKRIFGYYEAQMMDPFLMLDHFGSSNPRDYLAGFPWHPHRGIETVTYMIHGEVEHGDSLGNKGVIRSGDVQWMTAGSGIIHQEMPQKYQGTMRGFQLWVNLPAKDKMIRPRYRDVLSSTIPELELNGIRIKIISGALAGVSGPVRDIILRPTYLDIEVPAGTNSKLTDIPGRTMAAYVFEGQGFLGSQKGQAVSAGQLALFDEGDEILFATREDPVRFILISGEPLHEPIAWRGPIVMNTEEELDLAFQEYANGTFIKH